jgi:hypothetical protein
MDYSSTPEIVRLATEAAYEVAGADAVVRAEVEAGADWYDKPAYFFSFRIRKGKMFDLPPGLVRIRLIQHIVDKLITLGDTHEPIIRTLVLSDWEQSSDA